MKKIVIVDYDCGNLLSLKRGIEKIGLTSEISRDQNKILNSIDKKIHEGSSFISVNTNKVGDEEIKYTLKKGLVFELSKSVERGLGEAVGINYINSSDLKGFIKRLEECENQDYFDT